MIGRRTPRRWKRLETRDPRAARRARSLSGARRRGLTLTPCLTPIRQPSSQPKASGLRRRAITAQSAGAVPQPSPKRESEGWFARTLRTLFGWRRILARRPRGIARRRPAARPASRPTRARMLKNILGLRERRIEDVMVPRADIIAVQQDIALGELIKVFENAGHSRLVVYNDTLDDPIGMVHIRDLIAFMTAKAAAPEEERQAQEAAGGRPRSQGDRSVHAAVGTKIVREILFVPPSMPAHRPAGQDAGDAHPSRAGDRRIWRHRRPRLDRGHCRADRRRDRRRARRGRARRASCASPTVRSSPTRARTLRKSPPSIGADFDVGDAAKEVDTLGGYLVDADRPRAGARRTGPRPGPLRDRGARRRPAAGEEAARSIASH